MNEQAQLTLSKTMISQILDALHQRVKAWTATEEFLRVGYSDECEPIEECDHPEEAHKIAEYYKEIIDSIERQTYIHH